MTRRLSAGAFALGLVVTAACGKKSPGDTVRSLYTACSEARYSEVEPLIAESVRPFFLKSSQAIENGGVKTWCDRMSHNGTVVKVDIVKEEIRGEGAVVTSNISFKDGPPLQGDQTNLLKEDGAWRITFSR
jgi:hypothetical protein